MSKTSIAKNYINGSVIFLNILNISKFVPIYFYNRDTALRKHKNEYTVSPPSRQIKVVLTAYFKAIRGFLLSL